MTRGRRSTKGVEDAIDIARTRGTVMQFCPEPEIVSNFLIRNFSSVTFVRVKRTPRISCSFADIEAGFQDPLARLRTIPLSAGILCELWTYTKNCTWRFFRIDETGLLEIDRQGTPLVRPVKEEKASAKSAGPGQSRGNPDTIRKVSDVRLTVTGDPIHPEIHSLSETNRPGSPSEGISPGADPGSKTGTKSQKSGTKKTQSSLV